LDDSIHEQISSRISSQDFSVDLFDAAAKEVLSAALALPYALLLLNFAHATIYMRRLHHEAADIPEELHQRFLEERDEGFSLIGESHNVKVFRKQAYGGICMKDQTIIRAPAAEVAAFVRDTSTWCQWETGVTEARMLEKMSDLTHISYRKINALPGMKQIEMITLNTMRKMENGMLVCVGCSVDHKDAPITRKVARAIALTQGFIVQELPDDPNSSLFEFMYHMDYSKQKFLRMLTHVDFITMRASSRIVLLRKLLEKQVKNKSM